MADIAIAPNPNFRQEESLRPGLRFRRFGRTDFERFDQEEACGDHLYAGSGNIGKVEVECKYHWRKAQWGVLGPNRKPAGIIYIDLSLKQPPEHLLSHASILITLSEDTPPAPRNRFGLKRPVPLSLDSEHSVQVTDYFGPNAISGPQRVSLETREKAFEPTLGAGGFFELGGMGYRRNITREYIDSWTFKGTRRRAKDGIGLRVMEWELKESETERQPLHNHVFHTAFAFEHRGKPVNMRVEIEGRLKSRMRQGKHKLSKFCSKSSDKDHSSVIQIDLSSAQTDFRKRLDTFALALDQEMKEMYRKTTPAEMPGPARENVGILSPETDADTNSYEITDEIQKAQIESINELMRFAQQSFTRQPTVEVSQPAQLEYGMNSVSGGEETLVGEESYQNFSIESRIPKQIGWRVPEIMALALIRWLVLMLKAMGTDAVDLPAVTITKIHADKTESAQGISVDQPAQDLRGSFQLEETPGRRKLLDASEARHLANGFLDPQPHGIRVENRRRQGHVVVSDRDARMSS